jgi:hypothetical protein
MTAIFLTTMAVQVPVSSRQALPAPPAHRRPKPPVLRFAGTVSSSGNTHAMTETPWMEMVAHLSAKLKKVTLAQAVPLLRLTLAQKSAEMV